MTKRLVKVSIPFVSFIVGAAVASAAESDNVIRGVDFGAKKTANKDCRPGLGSNGGTPALSESDKDALLRQWADLLHATPHDDIRATFVDQSLYEIATGEKNATRFTIVRSDDKRNVMYVIVESPNHLLKFWIRDAGRRLEFTLLLNRASLRTPRKYYRDEIETPTRKSLPVGDVILI